ncbi:MAG: peptide ABC transporter substrate-binding protein, partial [Candidatus Hydrogenedentes bacterium]|nr:peptide ABC transporter substrate-binding protein [Candidatus Hydrogenedentota bacterium]
MISYRTSDHRVKGVVVRKFAVLLLLAGFFGATLWGCSGAADGPGAHLDPQKVLRINNEAEPQDLDPHVVTGVPEHRLNCALSKGLVDLDPETLQPIPGAAASWELSADQRVYTFHLRENGKWSNGDPVTAQDFAYSFERMLHPALAADYAYMLYYILNAKPFNEGTLKDFSQVGVKVIDDRTLEVTLEHPTPYWLGLQIHQSYSPVHRATIEKFGGMTARGTQWTRGGNFVGNGPFKLVDWRPNEYILVEKNDFYYDVDKVRLDGIRFFPIENKLTEERSFRSGEIQMTTDVPRNKIPVYKAENPDVLHIDSYLGVYYYLVNTTRKPLDDKRVRQALSLSLNRDALTRDVLKAGEKPAYYFVPPGIPGYESVPALRYDVDEARRLLAEAGFPGGAGCPEIELLYNTSENHQQIAEALQNMWKEALNINVTIRNQDWKVYLDTRRNLDYFLARAGWIGDMVDPVNFLELLLSTGGNNQTGFASEKYDQLLAASHAEIDPERRRALLHEMEAIVLDELPFIPMYFYSRPYLRSPEVKGYRP